MATPTNLPASFTAGAILGATQMNNIRGAFRILQVVFASTTTTTQTTSGTYVDTTLTANITPQATSSQILAFVTHSVYASTSSLGCNLRLVRGSTTLATTLDHGFGTGSNSLSTFSLAWLDSPSSTSVQTYKTQMAKGNGTGTVFTQVNNNPGTLVLMEVSA